MTHTPTSTYAQEYLPLFHTYQNELLQRLETLVNIDSGTGQMDGVSTVITHMEQWLRDLGFTVSLHLAEGLGPNLVARRAGQGTKRILLVGHIDTVYNAGAVRERPFAIEEDRARGPGVVDMKSGVVMGMYALRALLESGFDSYRELVLVVNNDEEVGSPGSAPLLREVARQMDVGLVLEPSGSPNVLTRARKGADKYVLEVFGVSAHSGVEPQKGRSAVLELAHKIIAIANLHALFPTVTFNVTRISSSEQLNIVPDYARCHISVRAFNEKMLQTAFTALEGIVAGASVPGTRSTLTRNPGRRPYESTPEILHLFQLARSEGEVLDLHLEGEVKGGVSDANVLVEAGLPTLDGLGPIGGGMHNLELEYVRIPSIPIRGALLAGLIRRICEE